MDPMKRMLLEVSYESIENGKYDPLQAVQEEFDSDIWGCSRYPRRGSYGQPYGLLRRLHDKRL